MDSKAVKLAIGVPVHTNKSDAKAGRIFPSKQRKLVVSKYVSRSLAVINSVTEDFFFIHSNKDYPPKS